jgi:PAS domain S-box-containing protein
MIRFLTEGTYEAKKAGFGAFRFAGEMTWALGGHPGTKLLIEYEAKLNRFLGDHDALGICQYDRARFSPEIIRDVIRTHPIVVYGGLVCKNPYYAPPDQFLGKNVAAREVRRELMNLPNYERTLEALRMSEERFRSLVAGVQDYAIFMLDPRGRVASWNIGAERIKGYREQEILGQDFSRFYSPEDIAKGKPKESLRVAAAVGSFQEDGWRVRKDGSRFWASATTTAIRNQEGELIGFSKVVRDLTERMESEIRLRQLSAHLVHSQDQERRRIARQLHETTVQSLIALKMNLARISRSNVPKEKGMDAVLFESFALTEQCLQEIRTLSHLLHPPLMDEVGLLSALRWYVLGFGERSGISVTLDAPSEIERLPHEMEAAVFRIAQEALTNIHCHSGSPTAKVRIVRNPDNILLEVEDKGRGMDPAIAAQGAGVGIAGMRERINQLGGNLEIQSSSRGTKVTAVLPIRGEGP